MANVVRFPNRARAQEEASLWLAKVDKGISTREQTELKQWLQSDPYHRAVFMEMAALWDEIDVMADLSGLFPLDQTAAHKAPRRHSAKWALATAASVCVAVAGWLLIGQDGNVPAPGVAAPVVPAAQVLQQAFATTVGMHAIEELPDGSVLALNTDTQVRIEYSPTSRDVFLQRGEAHFSVAHDAAHPFNVHVGKQILQAVGTAFNVHLRTDGEVEVMVTEGKVKVTRIAEARNFESPSGGVALLDTTLVQGEIALLTEAAVAAVAPQIARLEPVAIDIKLAWQRGMLIFQGEALETMLAEVGRYTTSEFELADRELAQVRVAGYFRAGDIDGLLAALRDNFRIESQLVDNRIVLRAAR